MGARRPGEGNDDMRLRACTAKERSGETPSARVLNARIAAAMSRVRLEIEYSAREALSELRARETVIESAAEEYEQASLRRYLAEQALREAEARARECEERGAWPFDPMRWAAWLKLSLESDLSEQVAGQLDEEDAERRLALELPSIEPDRRDEAKRCFRRLMSGLLGIEPFDPVRFERACMARSAQAAVGCGQSDVMWSRRASAALGDLLGRLEASDLAEGRVIAKRQGWMDPQEASELEAFADEAGLCSHGIDPHYCPAGCGDRE